MEEQRETRQLMMVPVSFSVSQSRLESEGLVLFYNHSGDRFHADRDFHFGKQ
jgi:hypothetical protein